MKLINKIGFFLPGLLLFNAPLFSQVKSNPSLTNSKKETAMENQNTELKEYILLVRVPFNYGSDNAKEVRELWNTLLEKWKADGTYVTSFVYPNDGYLVAGAEKSVTNESVVSNHLKLVSNLILRAANYEAALELSKNCPVLAQGGMIEVREIQPRPQSIEQHIYFVDKFFIPKNAIEEFTQRMKYNRDFIKHLPGFIKDEAIANKDTNGDLILMTIAEWRNEDYLNEAKNLVQADYEKMNFNPAEFTERLHIKMERQMYDTYQK